MWQRMSESEGGSGGSSVDFMSTHPANAKRIQVRSIRFPIMTELDSLKADRHPLNSN